MNQDDKRIGTISSIESVCSFLFHATEAAHENEATHSTVTRHGDEPG